MPKPWCDLQRLSRATADIGSEAVSTPQSCPRHHRMSSSAWYVIACSSQTKLCKSHQSSKSLCSQVLCGLSEREFEILDGRIISSFMQTSSFFSSPHKFSQTSVAEYEDEDYFRTKVTALEEV